MRVSDSFWMLCIEIFKKNGKNRVSLISFYTSGIFFKNGQVLIDCRHKLHGTWQIYGQELVAGIILQLFKLDELMNW
jgi:hypothetical protein